MDLPLHSWLLLLPCLLMFLLYPGLTTGMETEFYGTNGRTYCEKGRKVTEATGVKVTLEYKGWLEMMWWPCVDGLSLNFEHSFSDGNVFDDEPGGLVKIQPTQQWHNISINCYVTDESGRDNTDCDWTMPLANTSGTVRFDTKYNAYLEINYNEIGKWMLDPRTTSQECQTTPESTASTRSPACEMNTTTTTFPNLTTPLPPPMDDSGIINFWQIATIALTAVCVVLVGLLLCMWIQLKRKSEASRVITTNTTSTERERQPGAITLNTHTHTSHFNSHDTPHYNYGSPRERHDSENSLYEAFDELRNGGQEYMNQPTR